MTDIKCIMIHNLTTWDGFIMDCITLFPYELVVLPIQDSRLRTALVLYMRVPHLARVIRVKWMFDNQQKYLNQRSEKLIFVLQHLLNWNGSFYS